MQDNVRRLHAAPGAEPAPRNAARPAPRRDPYEGAEGPRATPALDVVQLGMAYGDHQVLRDCSVTLAPGKVVALVGPNGAGKTTLLHLAAGLLEPTRGSVQVFGASPRSDTAALAKIALVGQDRPLYNRFSVMDMLTFGRRMNPRWDQELAKSRLGELGIPLRRKVDTLSGGQRTQLAITLALAKRPQLLLLDEPMADLDPLARNEVMRSLMATVAESGTTVLFCSHVIAELTETCDWLVVVNGGRIQISGDIDELVDSHRSWTGPTESADAVASRMQVLLRSDTGRQTTLLAHNAAPPVDPRWTGRVVPLEELVLAYLRTPDASALPRPTLTAL